MSKVVVYLHDSEDAHVFNGNYDASVTGGNCLLILENVPDLLNQNKGVPTQKIRTIYNPSRWDQVGVTDGVDSDIVDNGDDGDKRPDSAE